MTTPSATSPAVGFPGQGGDWRAAVRTLSNHADHPLVQELAEALGADAWSQLDPLDTRNSQPVVFVAALVAVEVAGIRAGDVAAVVGHSLGEVTACCFAGAITASGGLTLVRARAQLGHAQHAARPGAMAAVMRLPYDEVEWLRRSAMAEVGGVLDVAVINSSTQTVVSGDEAAVDALVERAEGMGGTARRLPIGGAFHSSLMVAAVRPFAARAQTSVIAAPAVPVVLSTKAAAVTRAEELPDALARSLMLPVRWPAAIAALRALGVARAFDAGPGEALTRLAKHEPAVAFQALPVA